MCGILFSIPSVNSYHNHRTRVETAMNTMKHRGPDEGNLHQLKNGYIGHQRLSILDIEGSHQPMISPDNRFLLSFNGEIYNFQALRKSLENRWHFHSHGDTEVILAGLILEGDNFVKKMEGMWAFAFWDTLEERLLLSRDRLGKKPIYYFSDEQQIHCTSELPSLLQLLTHTPEEDHNSRADYFKYGYMLPGFTIYKNIYEVLPGHNLSIQSGKLQQTQYWQLNPNPQRSNNETMKNCLQELLVEAIKKRLIADVEVGSFLSGGIDSSLIVALAQKEMNKPLKTFSIGFEEESFNETSFAQIIANQYNTDHHVEILPEVSHDQIASLIKNHLGQPFADSSLLPTKLVSSVAAKKVKVALSGDGADELFSGYQRYTSRTIMNWYHRLPLKIRSNIEAVIRAIPEPHKHHSASLIKKAHLFADISKRIKDETPYRAPLFFSSEEFEQLLPGEWSNGNTIARELETTALDDIHQMMYADTLIYLPQDIMTKVDRASMSCSLETRSPFLDHKLVELAFSIPIAAHRKNLTGKHLLKKGFEHLLPPNIWQRRKQGFATPQSLWFKGPLGNQLTHLLEKTDTEINKQYVLSLLQTHQSGERDYGGKLWLIYNYLSWKNN